MKGREHSSRRKLIRVLMPILALVLAGVTVYAVHSFRSAPAASDTAGNTARRPEISGTDTIIRNGERYVRRSDTEAYLLMGIDDASYDTENAGGHADALILLVTDPRAKSYTLLQINRDSVTQIPVLTENGRISDTIYAPVCLAHAFGSGGADSCENTVRAVRYLLSDVPIRGYAALSLDGLGAFNDAVGGVAVTIDRDLTAVDPLFTAGAEIRLTAESAEAFLRARKELGQSDNVYRMARHRQYLQGWISAARSLADGREEGFAPILDAMEQYVVTDMTEKKLSSLANELWQYSDGGMITLDGENIETESYNEFHVSEDSIQEALIRLLYDKE